MAPSSGINEYSQHFRDTQYASPAQQYTTTSPDLGTPNRYTPNIYHPSSTPDKPAKTMPSSSSKMGEDIIMQDSPPRQQARSAFSPWSDATALMATPAQVARFKEGFQQTGYTSAHNSRSTTKGDVAFSTHRVLSPSSDSKAQRLLSKQSAGGDDARILKATPIPAGSHASSMRSKANNPFRKPTSRKYTRKLADLPMQASLLGMPGEIRNEIYYQVLGGDESMDIADPFPPITRVCKRPRTETMPMYFGIDIFEATLENSLDLTLYEWLNILGGIRLRLRQTLQLLRIMCIGESLQRRKHIVCPYHQPPCVRWFPVFCSWDLLIGKLQSIGFHSEEVAFESALLYRLRNDELGEDLRRAGGDYREVVKELGKEDYLSMHFILPPLLRIHRLYDPKYPPDAFMKILLEEERLQDDRSRGELREMALEAARKCVVPPEHWFERYALSLPPSELTGRSAAIEEECARSFRERLTAAERGIEVGHVADIAYRCRAGLSHEYSNLECKECLRDWAGMELEVSRRRILGLKV